MNLMRSNLTNKNKINDYKKTLFKRIGGAETVNATVTIFYEKVLADRTINHFFSTTHMEEQIGKQRAFLAYAFGTPVAYTGKSLPDVHAL